MTQTTLLSPAEETLWQIRQAKLAYLNRLFKILRFYPVADEMFKDIPDENIDYFSCHYSVMLTDEEIQADLIFKLLPPEIVVVLGKIGQAMQRIGYKPPLDITEQKMHLTAMWNLYKADFTWPPTQEDLWLDFSYTNLTLRVHGVLVSRAVKGEQNAPRTRKSTRSKSKKANEGWKSFIRGIYEHGKPIAPETKLSETIRMIQEQFEKSMKGNIKERQEEPKWGFIPEDIKRVPHRDSIIQWLKEEGILERDFEKIGKFWLKRM